MEKGRHGYIAMSFLLLFFSLLHLGQVLPSLLISLHRVFVEIVNPPLIQTRLVMERSGGKNGGMVCVCVCVCHRSQVSHLESSLGKSCFLLRTQICVRIVEQGCVSITPRKWLRKKHIISVIVKIYSAYKLLVVYSQVGNYGQNDN